jgi:hypothetical protein
MEKSLEYCDICEDTVDEVDLYCEACHQNVCYDCEGWCCDNPSE